MKIKKVKNKNQKEKKKESLEPKLIDISELDANIVDKRVKLNIQITGEQRQKALSKVISITCVKCGEKEYLNINEIHDLELLKGLVFDNTKLIWRRGEIGFIRIHGSGCLDDRGHKLSFNVLEYIDFSILHGKDLLNGERKFDQRIYSNRSIYLIKEKPPFAKKVSVVGNVIVDPKTRDICIIADRIKELEDELSNFRITEEDKQNFSVLKSDEDYKQVAPNIVGEKRKIAKEWYLNTIFSPATIPDIAGKLIRGCLYIIFIGDTKTAKSEIAKDFTAEGNLSIGEFVSKETGSRTGLLYTIDVDKNSLIWGSLPLNDLGFLVIDGLQDFSSEEIGEFRESLNNQKVVVRRSQQGEALARVRLVSCMNPGMRSDKPMNQYLYPCMAIRDSYIFSKSPDITRFDVFIPFCSDDVPAEEIVKRKIEKTPFSVDIFKRAILWAWSRTPNQIEYTYEATRRIINESNKLIENYAIPSLPLIHNGIRDVVCRISVAYASRKHSTDENHDKIIVREEHVREVVESYRKVLDSLMLSEYKLSEEGKLNITDNEFAKIIETLGEMEFRILDKIKTDPSSSSKLAEEFDVSEVTVKRHYEVLKKHGLIKAVPGVGVDLTPRGVIFLNRLSQGPSSIVSKNDTNSDELVSKDDTMTLGGEEEDNFPEHPHMKADKARQKRKSQPRDDILEEDQDYWKEINGNGE